MQVDLCHSPVDVPFVSMGSLWIKRSKRYEWDTNASSDPRQSLMVRRMMPWIVKKLDHGLAVNRRKVYSAELAVAQTERYDAYCI